jgi:putative Holliday junction resolvase
MPRYLAIDYGSRRIGLAVSDEAGRLATPLPQIESHGRTEEDVNSIRDFIADYGIQAVVLGLPLNMDDSESNQTRITRRFGERLAAALAVGVEYWDERLSSHAAAALLQERGGLTRRQRRARQDSLAAQLILQSFLDDRGRRVDAGGG